MLLTVVFTTELRRYDGIISRDVKFVYAINSQKTFHSVDCVTWHTF